MMPAASKTPYTSADRSRFRRTFCVVEVVGVHRPTLTFMGRPVDGIDLVEPRDRVNAGDCEARPGGAPYHLAKVRIAPGLEK